MRPRPRQPLAAGAALSNVLFGVNRAMLPRAPWPRISWWGIRKSEGPILYWVSSRYQTGGGEFQEVTNSHDKVFICYLTKLIVKGSELLGVSLLSTMDALFYGDVLTRRRVIVQPTASSARSFRMKMHEHRKVSTPKSPLATPEHSTFTLLPGPSSCFLRLLGLTCAGQG